jgi:hypothetical protein
MINEESPPWFADIATMPVFRHTNGMTIKFHGTITELKDRLLPLDLHGEWQAKPNGVWKFCCKDKAGLLWSETRGTIWFDGPPATTATLADKIEAILANGAIEAPISAGNKIFIVHGRDDNSREQLELILRRLGLEPFILQVTGGGGDTLIEALERMIGKTAQSSFGIVLATPDDMGYSRTDKPELKHARVKT